MHEHNIVNTEMYEQSVSPLEKFSITAIYSFKGPECGCFCCTFSQFGLNLASAHFIHKKIMHSKRQSRVASPSPPLLDTNPFQPPQKCCCLYFTIALKFRALSVTKTPSRRMANRSHNNTEKLVQPRAIKLYRYKFVC